MPTMRFTPLNGLRRLKSGFSFFDVGLKPTWATLASKPMIMIPTSIGATTPIAFHIALAANCGRRRPGRDGR